MRIRVKVITGFTDDAYPIPLKGAKVLVHDLGLPLSDKTAFISKKTGSNGLVEFETDAWGEEELVPVIVRVRCIKDDTRYIPYDSEEERLLEMQPPRFGGRPLTIGPRDTKRKWTVIMEEDPAFRWGGPGALGFNSCNIARSRLL